MNAAPVESYIEEIERLNKELNEERRSVYLLACRCERLQARVDELEAQQPQPKAGTCAQCGKETAILKGHRPRRFCSAACKQEHYRIEKLFCPRVTNANETSEVIPC